MKKNFITLFALLSMMAVSCQKENFTELVPMDASDVTNFSLSYTIDGASHHTVFHSNAERLAFIRRLVALAGEGYNISIADGNTTITRTSKEKVTFTTTSPDEAASWADKMIQQGYEVEIIFDEETGTYTCIAVK